MTTQTKFKPTQRTQEQRRAETQSKLLDSARKLFVELGFAETGTPDLVKTAGVTRGALYHHFKDKRDLFHGVAKREAEAIATDIRNATDGIDDPALAMKIGTEAYFDTMAVPGRARLLLAEAPAVLGHIVAKELTRNRGSRQLRLGLEQALPQLGEAQIDALSDALSAAFDRAALAIAEGADRKSYINALMLMIERLIASHQKLD